LLFWWQRLFFLGIFAKLALGVDRTIVLVPVPVLAQAKLLVLLRTGIIALAITGMGTIVLLPGQRVLVWLQFDRCLAEFFFGFFWGFFLQFAALLFYFRFILFFLLGKKHILCLKGKIKAKIIDRFR